MSDQIPAAIHYLRKEKGRYVSELMDFLRIPSVSSDSKHDEDIARAAAWVADRLKAIGASSVQVVKTGRHPVVFGEVRHLTGGESGKPVPTILIYGHYDVQRPDPVDEWQTDAFAPEIRSEELFARGAVDNKGPIVAAIAAVESLIESGSLPVNVKFMIEGEEEIGSPSLANYLQSNSNVLESDICLNGDSGMAAVGEPTITYGLRGSVWATLRVFGPSIDLHSGLFGGIVHNPIHAMADLISGLVDEKGLINLPGFYDDVLPMDDEERLLLAKIPRDEELTLALSGVPELWGDERYTLVERTGARPSLDVLMIQGGARKSAIPASATANISLRLVPNQSPTKAFEQLERYMEENAPPTVTWKLTEEAGSQPTLADRHSRWNEAMSRALKAVWQKEPLYDRLGGSIPAVSMLNDLLNIESVLIGVYRPGDNLHAPNEKLHLPTWEKMIETIIYFLEFAGE